MATGACHIVVLVVACCAELRGLKDLRQSLTFEKLLWRGFQKSTYTVASTEDFSTFYRIISTKILQKIYIVKYYHRVCLCQIIPMYVELPRQSLTSDVPTYVRSYIPM
jgi:hypothetical protein